MTHYSLRILVAAACAAVLAVAAPAAQAAVASPASNDLVPDLTFGSGHLTAAFAVDVTPHGELLVADPGSNDIARFTPDRTFIDSFDGSDSRTPLNLPGDVATDANGDIYVADRLNSRIAKFDPHGAFLSSFDGSDSPGHELGQPVGVAVHGSTVYVTDSAAHRVERFATDGTFLSAFGSFGAGDGQLDFPYAIDVNHAGDIYVADSGNNRVEVFNPDGSYRSQIGTSGTGPGQLDDPDGVSVDGDGNVLVGDTLNHRAQKFSADGTFLGSFGPQDSRTLTYGVAPDGATGAYLTTGDHITHYSPRAEATAVDAVGSDSATAHGIVRPNGVDTQYEFRWQRAGTTRWHHTALADAGSGTDPVPVSAVLPRLQPDADYIARLRIHIGATLEKTKDIAFTTKPTPPPVAGDITVLPVTDLTTTTATINADVAGHGGDDTVSVLYQREGSSYLHIRRMHTTDDLSIARRNYHRTLDVQPGTQYTYHLLVSNSAGGPVLTSGHGFTTPDEP